MKRGKWGVLAPYLVWMTVFIVVPLGLVLYYSLTATVDGQTVFTTEHFVRFFRQSDNLLVMWASIRVALVATVFCLVLGYPIAYILAEKTRNKGSVLLFLFLVPMWMNFLLRTYAWLTILSRNGILNAVLSFLRLPTQDILFTDTAVTLGMVYNFLPFMILPIYTALKNMDLMLIEGAQDLGANGFHVFVKVVFPLSLPGVITGIAMVFMPAVTTFLIPALLGGRQFILIGNLIEREFMHARNWNSGAAVAIVVIFMILAIRGVLMLLDRQVKDIDRPQEAGTLF